MPVLHHPVQVFVVVARAHHGAALPVLAQADEQAIVGAGVGAHGFLAPVRQDGVRHHDEGLLLDADGLHVLHQGQRREGLAQADIEAVDAGEVPAAPPHLGVLVAVQGQFRIHSRDR
ncbi:hypothetical protein D9M71_235860 [compost metagenome]